MAISRKDPFNVLHESIRDNCDILKGLDGEPKKKVKKWFAKPFYGDFDGACSDERSLRDRLAQ
jgi:hypothetical protein